MPKYRIPSSYTCGREGLKINNTVYHKGDAIPAATVKSLKKVSALLGNRDIIPDVDPHYRKTKLKTPAPTDVPPVVRKAM
jgi:hypothetical protein